MEITQMFTVSKPMDQMTINELADNVRTLKRTIKETESAMETLRLSGIYQDYNDRFAMDDAIKPILNDRYELLGRMEFQLETKLEENK